MSTTTHCAFQDDNSDASRASTHDQQAQAFYNTHANAAKHMRQFKWGIVVMLLVVGIAAWADEYDIPDTNNRIRSSSAVETSRSTIRADNSNIAADGAMTKFIDGPTGFVFIYTPEGWKFVPGSAAAN